MSKVYKCYVCEKAFLTPEEVIENDEWISSYEVEIYKGLLDKLDLVDCRNKPESFYNGIPAICDICIRKALAELFIEKYKTNELTIRNAKVRIRGADLVVINTNEEVYIGDKEITADFMKYFF